MLLRRRRSTQAIFGGRSIRSTAELFRECRNPLVLDYARAFPTPAPGSTGGWFSILEKVEVLLLETMEVIAGFVRDHDRYLYEDRLAAELDSGLVGGRARSDCGVKCVSRTKNRGIARVRRRIHRAGGRTAARTAASAPLSECHNRSN